jgi:DNA-binding CsgD family transcriptional regulator
MNARVVGRPAETRAVAAFLDGLSGGPSALVMEGEPGIGKTTLWFAALERARESGARVLTARPAEAESRMAYAALADLLGGVEDGLWAELPGPQRLAVDRVLLRAEPSGAATDRRAVGAALLSVLERLAGRTPLVLAVDDLQWVDPSSAQALAFAARRLTGPVGVLGTVRTGSGTHPVGSGGGVDGGFDGGADGGADWVRLARPEAVRRIRVLPLSLGALHGVLTDRTGRSFPRPAIVRIQEVSRGNPFFALELAQAMPPDGTGPPVLPGTLTELVRARVGGLAPDVRLALLAAASVGEPTVELVQRALDVDATTTVTLLEDAERRGVLEINGNRLRFTHPLLATGVYTDAAPDRRRAMHRCLAEIVGDPESRARHLALAAVRGDPETLLALDAAAATTRARGAPAAAAELLALAVSLGGDTPRRRIELARHHFDAGDTERARRLLEETVEAMPAGPSRARALSELAIVRLHDDSYLDAVELLRRALAEVDQGSGDQELRTRIAVELPYALVNLGRLPEAVERIEEAVAEAEGLGQAHLLSQALGLREVLRFLHGLGYDEPRLRRALALEDPAIPTPVMFRPSVQEGLLLAWTGHLERARVIVRAGRRRCLDRGEENDLVFMSFHGVLLECWRGDFAAASVIAEDTMERALQANADVPLAIACSVRAVVAAYGGAVDDARDSATEALTRFQRCGWLTLAGWPIATLGFLEVSLGEYQAALATLAPLLTQAAASSPAAEIVSASFLPDAVEALVGLGRLDEAEALLDGFSESARRLDRVWALAVAARGRAMLLAARGDLAAATVSVHRALAEHERLPMPFELARTRLLLGQLLRRSRRKDAAATALGEALAAFEELGTPLWAARARAELSRVNVAPSGADRLTPSERRVAELAASGMTNREVAAALFISPKTVEANLARVYRKLSIRSRAELGRRMASPGR